MNDYLPTERELREWTGETLAARKADEAEILIGGGHSSLTRFAENHIHQNVAEHRYHLRIRAAFGRRTGVAVTNRTDPEARIATLRKAEEAARHSEEDPDLPCVAAPAEYASVRSFDVETAGATPEQRVRVVGQAIDKAKSRDFVAAGFCMTQGAGFGPFGHEGVLALANSSGLFAHHAETRAVFSATVTSPDSTGWVHAGATAFRDLDVPALAHRAVTKAELGRRPKPLEPGDYDVILEPNAVASLVLFLGGGFGARAVDEGRSFLSERAGSKLFGDNFTLDDDPFHPLHQGRPFDDEGVPTRPIRLVDAGTTGNLLYDRATASRHGVEPTGHGLPQPNHTGAVASHLVVRGGSATLEDLVADTARGLLITRLWYNRFVDERRLAVTGLTRGGTFLIENGKITTGVHNLRFNESLLSTFSRIDGMTAPAEAQGTVVPAMRIRNFHFTAKTNF